MEFEVYKEKDDNKIVQFRLIKDKEEINTIVLQAGNKYDWWNLAVISKKGIELVEYVSNDFGIKLGKEDVLKLIK